MNNEIPGSEGDKDLTHLSDSELDADIAASSSGIAFDPEAPLDERASQARQAAEVIRRRAAGSAERAPRTPGYARISRGMRGYPVIHPRDEHR